jgi:hypothetical protein
MQVHDLEATEWFAPLMIEVQRELDRIAAGRPDLRPALEQEWRDLEDKKRGWSQSLAKPDLGPALRAAVEAEFEAALVRQQEIERQQAECDQHRQQVDQVVDPRQVVDRLDRLSEILAGSDPTMANLELSLHIDGITCFQDGRVIVRTCKLGALAPASGLLANPAPTAVVPASPSGDGTPRATPRRRARLRVADGGDERDLRAAAQAAACVHRFSGLDPAWFWEDTFQVPARACWSDQHAEEVAGVRRREGLTVAKLATHFGKSIPTIREALKKAERLAISGADAGTAS